MNVLVTGSSGFLGRTLCDLLDNVPSVRRICPYDKLQGFDITDQDQFRTSCIENDIQVVIHLAAVADLNMYRDDVGTSNTVNVDATSHVLQTCNELGIQLFFASTCCVYGNNHLPVQDETSDICPTDAYAAGKRASEVEILDNLAGNNHVIMRLATFYGGPHCRPALAIRKFIQQALKGETITVFGNGTQTRTYTHVHDVASGIIALVTHRDSLKHSIYNLTQSTPIAVMDILKSIHENIGGTLNIDFSETGRKGEDFDQQVIQSNRLREVGWSPQFTWSQGVRESVMIEQNLQE